MEVLDCSHQEDRLFDALGAIFELEPELALAISIQTVGHIASYVADMAAISGDGSAVEKALKQIEDMNIELNTLKTHLTEYEVLRTKISLH